MLSRSFKHRPDKEGIKTFVSSTFATCNGSNTDLIKKGLRRAAWIISSVVLCSNTDLIKKGLRLATNHHLRACRCSNTDLIKKGLRQVLLELFAGSSVQTQT